MEKCKQYQMPNHDKVSGWFLRKQDHIKYAATTSYLVSEMSQSSRASWLHMLHQPRCVCNNHAVCLIVGFLAD